MVEDFPVFVLNVERQPRHAYSAGDVGRCFPINKSEGIPVYLSVGGNISAVSSPYFSSTSLMVPLVFTLNRGNHCRIEMLSSLGSSS